MWKKGDSVNAAMIIAGGGGGKPFSIQPGRQVTSLGRRCRSIKRSALPQPAGCPQRTEMRAQNPGISGPAKLL
jgi:hypothetical protein